MNTNRSKTCYILVKLQRKQNAMKVHIGDIIFISPTGDGTVILRGHPSHPKVQPLAVPTDSQLFIKTLNRVRSRELNPRPPDMKSSALGTQLILQGLIIPNLAPTLYVSRSLSLRSSIIS